MPAKPSLKSFAYEPPDSSGARCVRRCDHTCTCAHLELERIAELRSIHFHVEFAVLVAEFRPQVAVAEYPRTIARRVSKHRVGAIRAVRAAPRAIAAQSQRPTVGQSGRIARAEHEVGIALVDADLAARQRRIGRDQLKVDRRPEITQAADELPTLVANRAGTPDGSQLEDSGIERCVGGKQLVMTF